jgi:hypothetical protein
VIDNGRRPWWTALRLTLVLLWVVAAALSWWTAPRKTGFEQARQDVTAGRVVVHEWGDHWETGADRWFGPPGLTSGPAIGPLFTWRTADGRVHWTDTGDFEQITLTRPADPRYAGGGAQVLGDQLAGRGVQGRPAPFGTVIDAIGIVLAVAFLSVLLAGPAPVRGTKWFWLWLGVTVPFGLGLMFWLLRDRPWAPAPERVPRTLGAEARDRGWVGLVAGILASLLISGLAWALNDVLGIRWIPLLA